MSDPAAYETIGRVSSASVFKATKRHWAQWVRILDDAGARGWTHQEIVAFLKKRYRLGPWWQQGVCCGYEVAIGRRLEGQNGKGEYTVTSTKSLAIDAKKAWKVLVSEEGQAAWLKGLFPIEAKAGAAFETEDGFFGEIRTLLKGRRLRMTWQDPNWEAKTTVQIHLVPRPNGKAILVFDHQQIKTPQIQARLRRRWKAALAKLAELMPQPRPQS